MQQKDTFKRYHKNKMDELFKKIEKPALPMLISNWIFGIGILEYPLGYPHRIISFIYTATISIGYCWLSVYAYPFLILSLNDEFEITKVFNLIAFYVNFAILTITAILGWHRHKGMQAILSQLALADEYIEKLGVPRNYDKEFRKQIRKMACFFMFVVFIVFLNSLQIVTSEGKVYEQVLIAIVMNYPIIVMFAVDAIFINILGYARSNINIVNGILKGLITSTDECPQHSRIIKKYLSKNTSQDYGNLNITLDKTSTIATAKKAHLEIIKACRQVDETFGLHILVTLAIAITIITGCLYHLYMFVKHAAVSFDFFRVVVDVTTLLVYYFIKIFAISSYCNAVVVETTATGDIISEIYDELSLSKETQDELVQNSFVFEAHGFITLDFTLIQGMVSSVTTYLMILIQLGNAQLSKAKSN